MKKTPTRKKKEPKAPKPEAGKEASSVPVTPVVPEAAAQEGQIKQEVEALAVQLEKEQDKDKPNAGVIAEILRRIEKLESDAGEVIELPGGEQISTRPQARTPKAAKKEPEQAAPKEDGGKVRLIFYE